MSYKFEYLNRILYELNKQIAMDYFPLVSCILVGSCILVCCLRNRSRNQYRAPTPETRQTDYIVLPTEPPPPEMQILPSAPPLDLIYEEPVTDPVV